jgi:hypothetical protein
MTMKERADLGFADALEDFDPAEWALTPAPRPGPRPGRAGTRTAAAAAGFRSREPRPDFEPGRAGEAPAPAAERPAERPADPAPAPVRRRRTGRNAQLNLKARPETIAAFCAVADLQGWGLGVTLEHAVALLEREYKRA